MNILADYARQTEKDCKIVGDFNLPGIKMRGKVAAGGRGTNCTDDDFPN
jgi:hypothetical protein